MDFCILIKQVDTKLHCCSVIWYTPKRRHICFSQSFDWVMQSYPIKSRFLWYSCQHAEFSSYTNYFHKYTWLNKPRNATKRLAPIGKTILLLSRLIDRCNNEIKSNCTGCCIRKKWKILKRHCVCKVFYCHISIGSYGPNVKMHEISIHAHPTYDPWASISIVSRISSAETSMENSTNVIYQIRYVLGLRNRL